MTPGLVELLALVDVLRAKSVRPNRRGEIVFRIDPTTRSWEPSEALTRASDLEPAVGHA